MTELSWQPRASVAVLRQRAAINAAIREFFCCREVLEVETPLLGRYSVTDPHMNAVSADNPLSSAEDSVSARYFLQTSPEYAMKRLLAAGSGAIFQICKAFRAGELGSRHNPEFTLLEWYRPGFDHHELMTELAALIAALIPGSHCRRCSYAELFEQHFALNPHRASCHELERVARQHVDVQMHSEDRDDWLHLLIGSIEGQLGHGEALFIYDYPASQAALAKITYNASGDPVAERFELYAGGIELANGYHELSDASELRQRFTRDRQLRAQLGRVDIDIDESLMAAMASGLPACAGVALGLDRLMMLALGLGRIEEVLSFSADNA